MMKMSQQVETGQETAADFLSLNVQFERPDQVVFRNFRSTTQLVSVRQVDLLNSLEISPSPAILDVDHCWKILYFGAKSLKSLSSTTASYFSDRIIVVSNAACVPREDSTLRSHESTSTSGN